jgi:hypothetical protein
MRAVKGEIMAETNADLRMEADSLAPGTIIGERFIVHRKLGAAAGRGVPGRERRRRHEVLRHQGAAARLLARSTLCRDAAQEAKKQAKLDHVNVVRCMTSCAGRYRCCLVQTYVKGSTLAQLLDKQPGGLPSMSRWT